MVHSSAYVAHAMRRPRLRECDTDIHGNRRRCNASNSERRGAYSVDAEVRELVLQELRQGEQRPAREFLSQ